MVGSIFSLKGLFLGVCLALLASNVNAQTAPVFTSSPVLTGTYASLYAYAISTNDAEDSSREIVLTNGTLPAGLALVDNADGTALLQGLPLQVGSFAIELTVRELNAPFQEDIQSFNLTVGKATLTVTPLSVARVYGQNNPPFSLNMMGFLNGDNASNLDVAPTATTLATMASNAGDYVITANGGVDDAYDFVYQSGTLTVQKAMLQVTAEDKTKVYGAPNPAFTVQYSGFVLTDNAGDLDVEPIASTGANVSSPVGSYAITLSGGVDNNYQYNFINGQLSVSVALLTASADSKTRAYGAPNPTLTVSYTGFVNGDDAADLDVAPTANTLATISSPTGNYGIGVSGGVDNNYAFTYDVGQLTITKATLNILVNDVSRTYGQPNPNYTFSYAGFLNSDDANDLDVLPTTSTSATISSNVGVYPIVLAGGSDNNYSYTYTSGDLTINKALLTVTANDKSKVYGTANPILTVDYLGFLNGDDVSDVNSLPLISTSATNLSPVGTYTISVSGGSDNNYGFTFINGNLDVTKALLIASAENKARAYASANPFFTIAYSGFVNGDDVLDIDTSPTVTTLATITSDVGVYSLIPGSGFDNNYTFSYVGGILTITQAVLTVTADNATRTFATANPALTYTLSGFLLTDDATDIDVLPTAATTATISSSVGAYPITVSGGLDNNYSFVYQSGSLTITKATATVQITNLLQNVSGLPMPVTIETTPAGLTVNVLYNGSAAVPSTKGTYSITATINETNYQGSASATYLLNGPPVLLSAPSMSFNEDSGNHSLNLTLHVDDTEQTESTLVYAIVSNSNSALFQAAILSGFTLTLNPATDKYGVATIGIRATDSQGMFLDFTVAVTVNNVQDAPVFTSNPVLLATQNQFYSYTVATADVDLGDLLTISSSIALPGWLTLVNHGNGTATLSGTPRAEDIKTHGIALRVGDDKGNFANQFFNITVQQAQFPPEFTSVAITTARENIVYSYTATTTDVNGGAIVYSATSLPNWLSATANGNGGFVLNGTPNLTHVFFENGNQEFTVVITATDNTGLIATQSFQIRVLYENSPPTITLPITTLTLAEDAPVTDISLLGITDGGEIGQVIAITAASSPGGLVQSDVTYQSPQTTGTLHIQPLPNMHGTTTLQIRVQDNGRPSKNFVTKEIAITVTPVNDAPAIVSTPVIRVNPNSMYNYSILAADVDATDVLSFQKLIGPSWLTISSTGNREGLLTGNVPANATDVLVRIQTTDLAGATAIQEFTLIINKAPVLQSASASIKEDEPIFFDRDFFGSLITDPNPTDVVSFIKITKLPLGELRHNGQSIALNVEIPWQTFTQLTYTPPLDYFGTDFFEWNVSDGLLLAATAAKVELAVSTENDPPDIRNLETTNITYSQGDPGVPISSSVTLADVDDANLIGAVIAISQSFDPSTDVLILTKPDGETSSIASSFNNATGELTLSGEASKSDYENALRNVRYKSNFLGRTANLSRQISIRVSDLISQSQTVTRNLTIIRVLPDIDIVSAFTPNGDGINDTWDFNNLIAYTAIEIFVYDSTGRRVYECRNSNCAWDGTLSGSELPPGPYLYTIRLEEGRREYNGTVTLLK